MDQKTRQNNKIAEAFSDPDRITRAVVRGVTQALLKHKQAGNPIVVWRDGKMVWLEPEDIPVQKH